MKPKFLEPLQESLSELLKANGLENMENPLNSLIKSKLENLNFVSEEDFNTQKMVLEKLREKVKALEQQIEALGKKA